MGIDKSIRQYYSRGQLVRPGPGRPGYQGPAGGYGDYGGSSSPYGGGGGGGEDRQAAQQATREAERKAAQQAAAQRAMQATIAAAEKKAAAPPRQIYEDPDPVTETVPGDVTFEPRVKYTPPVRHPTVNTNEEADKLNRQKEMRDLIAQQQEEKYDVPVDPTKFGETVQRPDLRTEREKEEDWERSLDWDKIDELNKGGFFRKNYSFKEIQDAMEKGLLTKTDPRSIKTNLLSRGVGALKNLIPRTGLERSLLSGLKKSFAPTEGGMLDPKRIALNFAKNYAMKKLGLGALNPLLGIASLFGIDPIGWAMNKFSRKPRDMTAFNKLGLQADRYPTGTTEQARVGAGVRGVDIPTQQAIAGGKGLESGAELLGLKEKDEFSDIEEHQAKLKGLALGQMRVLQKKQGMEEFGGEEFTPKDQRMLDKLREMDKEEKVYRTPILTAANGGLINLYRHGGFSG